MTGRPVAAALASWRARLGLTQAGAAARLRVPLRTLQGWELGRPCARADTVLRLCWFEEGCPFDEEPVPVLGQPRQHKDTDRAKRRRQRAEIDETLRRAIQ